MKYRKSTYVEDGGAVIEIKSPPSVTRPDQVEDEQHQFIRDNWEGFAAAAYEGFRRFGAGALVVNEGDGEARRVPHPFASHAVWYATTLDGWTELGRDPEAAAWWKQHVEDYEPRDTCLFIFLREGEHPRLYFVEGSLRPVEALSRAKSMLN